METNDALGSKAQQQLRNVFNKIDRDGSGAISVDEFSEACNDLSVRVTAEELTEFVRSDVSGDGQLDFDEFSHFYTSRLRKVFDEIDTNASGEINSEELKDAFEILGYTPTEREVKVMLANVDEDSNEQINFAEFSNYFCSMPSPTMKAVIEKWSSGLFIDTGSDLAPPPLPPASMVIWKALFAGGVAGVISRTFTAPLEKTKILAQTSTCGQLRISETISSIWKNESWRGFFAGNGANCLRVLPFSALVCLAYYNMAKHFPLDQVSSRRNTLWRWIAGLGAGTFATLLTHPMDVVRARLTVQDQSHKQYRGIIDGIMKVAKDEKLPGLYKGIVPTMLAIAPFIALQQVTYDMLKQKATERNIQPSVTLFLVCGGLSGIVAQTAVYPLDVARRRMQIIKETPSGTSMGLRSLLRTLTYKELFSGITITYLKVMPAGAISLLVRDYLLGRLKKQ